jgi:putative ABC transport system permease protein
MRVFETMGALFQQTWANVSRNKLRSFLTMFGIAWGITALAIMNGMGDGFRKGQRQFWKQIGNNLVIVMGGRTERVTAGQTARRYVRLYERDVEAIRKQCPDVKMVTSEVKRYGVRAVSSFNSGQFLVVGITPEYLLMRNLALESGRHISEADVREGRRVCVLGSAVRKQLFEERREVLGQQIRINGHPYQVVGLMAEKRQSSSYDGWDKDKIAVAAPSLRRDCPPNKGTYAEGLVQAIMYQPASATNWKTAQRQVRSVLGRLHNFDPEDEAALFTIDYVRLAEVFDKVFTTGEIFLAFVALVTLSLGGVGVMNTMLMAVSERTNEIGLKKALGATRRRILADFFMEGLLLAALSGAGGMAFVSLLATLVNSLPQEGMFAGLPLQARTLMIGLASLGTVAVISALPPAWRASRLQPVEALRYER